MAAMAAMVAVMAAATTVVADFTAEAAASMAAVRPFTAADFVVMSSTAAFAMVDIGSCTGITFTGISIMRRPIIITRTAIAGWSGPITDRAGSAAIARGITTTGATTIGIIAIGEVRDDG
jgi:hypothetical protein